MFESHICQFENGVTETKPETCQGYYVRVSIEELLEVINEPGKNEQSQGVHNTYL